MDIKEIIKDYKIDKRIKITERGELLREFVSRVNDERDLKKFRAITFSRMAFLLGHIKTNDLYAFLSMCNDRLVRNGSFSKFFWWALKAK